VLGKSFVIYADKPGRPAGETAADDAAGTLARA
jgi:hypothetical protein